MLQTPMNLVEQQSQTEPYYTITYYTCPTCGTKVIAQITPIFQYNKLTGILVTELGDFFHHFPLLEQEMPRLHVESVESLETFIQTTILPLSDQKVELINKVTLSDPRSHATNILLSYA